MNEIITKEIESKVIGSIYDKNSFDKVDIVETKYIQTCGHKEREINKVSMMIKGTNIEITSDNLFNLLRKEGIIKKMRK
jgi:hypothetical protein